MKGQMTEQESNCIAHVPCPECGSKDNLGLYSDGHGFCFGCGHYLRHAADGGGDAPPKAKTPDGLIGEGTIKRLLSRKITEETCAKFNYRHVKYKGQYAQVADYYDARGKLVAQKLRFPDKSFVWLGDAKKATLYGSQLWGKGRKIVVTEGEIDALSMAQVQGLKWAVVSVPGGAQGAPKHISKCLEYLSNFEEVVLMFDMDEPGQKAAQACAEVLGPGRCKIAHLPLKDANDMLLAGRTDELIQAMWNAKPYQPEGVIAGADLLDLVLSEDEYLDVVPYPWPNLNLKTHGLRRPEITTFTAGTGVGKSAIVRELAYHLGVVHKQNVGMIMLEETTRRSALGLMGLHSNRLLHISKDGVTEEDMRLWFQETLGTGRYHFIDHFGSTEVETLMNRIRYLVTACDCRWIILDHLSIVVSGASVDVDERRTIDAAMTHLATMVKELGFGLLLVHHLKRPEGRGHEVGGEVHLGQLRGSHGVSQLSDTVFGIERNQQGDNPNYSKVKVLKNRLSGETGVGTHLLFDAETGRLIEVPDPASGFRIEDHGPDDGQVPQF